MDKDKIKIKLDSIGQLPKNITDITENISKGASSVAKMTDKMQSTVEKIDIKNPVGKRIIDITNKTVESINSGAHKIAQGVIKLDDFGHKIAEKVEPLSDFATRLNGAINDLDNCKAVLGTSSLLVNAVVDTVSGHFHPRDNEKLFSQFDNQWDSWAKTVDSLFHDLSPDQKSNVLEALAKEYFGDNIYALGSAIKNESAGIFGGIADFESALHSFRGGFRNPAEAMNKIENGVKGIIRATERVANSLNNMIKTYQKGVGEEVKGNPVLSYIGSLHNKKIISGLNITLSVGTGAFTLSSDVAALGESIKSKNPLAIYNAGKKTIDDVNSLRKALKGEVEALKKMPSGTSNPSDSATPLSDKTKVPEQNSDDDRNQDKSDSYVCSKAKIKCSLGDKISTLTVFPDRTIWLTGEPQANISDHISMQNIAPFGKCHTTAYPATGSATAAAHGKLTPMPCVPNTPFPWMNGKNDVLLKGQPALLKSSICKCVWGGTISITFDGQTSGTGKDVNKEERIYQDELNSEIKFQLSAEYILDGIQLALDTAGFVPGIGAVPDLINASISAFRGNWGEAGLSLLAAVPVIGDAAAAARLCHKGTRIAKGINIGRKTIIAAEASKYVGKNASLKQLIKKGICKDKKEFEFFQKSLRNERKKFAEEFYKKHGVTDKATIESHINGIDLNHPIKVKKMPPPNRLNRYDDPTSPYLDTPGSYMGYEHVKGQPVDTPRRRGIQPVVTIAEGKPIRKKKFTYELSQESVSFEYLESTASPTRAPLDNKWSKERSDNNWKPTKGGAKQVYIPKEYLKMFILVK